ncbi:Phospholipid-lipopolysaccharide ABC transporter [Tenacibaculum sp. 190524A02b]|uniref:ATP-binding cassette domain-containing protein n=1 Tax=Tenacibaculum vairaonense TaxID=3137860 RepID=A0ABM9PRP8_9FLAO
MINKIIQILPQYKISSLFKYQGQLLLLNLLDLISVAYLIPIITLILSKEKFVELLEKYNVGPEWITKTNLIIFLIAFTFFYIIKNSIQIKINKNLLEFLKTLKSLIAEKRVENFINGDYLYYKEYDRGELINVVMQATVHFCSKLLYPLMQLVSELLLLLILVATSFYIQWQFMLLLLSVFMIFGISMYLKKRMSIHKINEQFFSLHTKVSSIILDILNGVLDIKSSQSESFFIEGFKTKNKELNQITSTLEATGYNYSKYFEICLVICITLMGYYFYNNSLGVINLSILAGIGFKIIPSLNKILNYLTLIKAHSYSIDILIKYDREKKEERITEISFKKEIQLKEISFGFKKSDAVFNHVNFSIKPTEIIGVKGATGVGKTTLLQIIMGLIDPKLGSRYVDSKKVDCHFLSFTSYVNQQPYLFNKTVLENITMGKENVDYEYLNSLCEKLELSSTISNLREKYDTQIVQNDSFFSGGQKQRICIARALYSKPKLLILDEATNQQDSVLENKIFHLIHNLAKQNEMAVIVVSHNKELEKFYDKTYEVKDKKIVLL